MDALTAAEILEIRTGIMDYVGMQFQYWLAMTFALLAAIHVTGESFGKGLKIGIALLYSSSSFLFLSLYLVAGTEFRAYSNELSRREIDLFLTSGASVMLGNLRLAIWVVGTIATVWYLFHKSRRVDT